MKTLNNYITEGLFKNIGAEPDKLIEGFIRNFIYKSRDQNINTADIKRLEVNPGVVYRDDNGEWNINLEQLAHDNDARYFALVIESENRLHQDLDLFNALSLVSDNCLNSKFNSYHIELLYLDRRATADPNIMKLIKDKFAWGFKVVDAKGLKSFDNFPIMKKKWEIYGDEGRTQIGLYHGEFTDLKGCPDCSDLYIGDNEKLTSLSGSNIKLIHRVHISNCPNIQTFVGGPSMAKGGFKLYINYGGAAIGDMGWEDMIKKCTGADYIGVPLDFLKDVTPDHPINNLKRIGKLTIYKPTDKHEPSTDEWIDVASKINKPKIGELLLDARGMYDYLKQVRKTQLPNVKHANSF